MVPHWTQQIASALAAGQPTATLEWHLDTLLLWLSNPDSPRTGDLDQAFKLAGMDRWQAATQAYRVLDLLLFPSNQPPSAGTLGLTGHENPDVAKQRYRRLIQVYHPDRHPDRSIWATRHTELINRAFAAYRGSANRRQDRSDVSSQRHENRRASHSGQTPWSQVHARVAAGWQWLCDWTRDGAQRRERLLAGAAILGALIIGLPLLLQEPPKPPPRIIDHPLDQPDKIITSPAIQAPTIAQNPMPPVPAPIEAEPPATGLDPAAATAGQHPEQTERRTPIARAEITSAAAAFPDTKVPEPTPQIHRQDADSAVTAPLSITPAEPTAAVPEHTAPAPNSPPVGTSKTPVKPPPSGPALIIPPAAPPESPIPPTSPEPPLQSSAAPVATPSAPEAAPATSQCRLVPEMLQRFQHAYQSGGLDQLMSLYSPSAKENELSSWFSIRATYRNWFSKTSERSIRFDRLHVQPTVSGERCAAVALFNVTYRDAQSEPVSKSGAIQFLFERQGEGLRILRVRY